MQVYNHLIKKFSESWDVYLKSGYISHSVTLDIMLLTLIQQTYSARTRQLKFTFTDILKKKCWYFQTASFCLVTLALLVLDKVTKALLLSQPTILILESLNILVSPHLRWGSRFNGAYVDLKRLTFRLCWVQELTLQIDNFAMEEAFCPN